MAKKDDYSFKMGGTKAAKYGLVFGVLPQLLAVLAYAKDFSPELAAEMTLLTIVVGAVYNYGKTKEWTL